ncbi:hypothetical protein PLESTB_001419700 [Pleodorina starrii]|uniref:Uncharacterized protein n=1 Tax=Pleodorina starrii TaxID=330485 RepID=A0A9W6BWQ0_9CHLO|nr:hypothetical protein PLESTM_001381600 [Pleodorina starrii]GLC58941.1 hypothetical protein PLESTB_001419700 [Pleodorina starrii]GLC65102.1 hypothetical protein PLESTF_000246800 [Pleodorina starrii]
MTEDEPQPVVQPSTADQPHSALPWGIVLDNVWAQLRPAERTAIVETCKDAWLYVRRRLQTHICLYISRALASHLATTGRDALKTRYPFANRLTLRYDRDVMEEEDGLSSNSNEDRGRAASSVVATLGRHEGIKACRLDYWEYLPQSCAMSLLAALPSLDNLELNQAYRLDLEAVLIPGLTRLTSLTANADHILMAPELLRSAPVLTQLQELRLSQLQVNDQPADNALCQALGALTGLTLLELVTFSAATRTGMVALKGIHNETLRPHPLARLPSTLAALSRLRCLVVSDTHLEKRTANGILGALPALTQLTELVMPEARTREEGWLALQQCTTLTRVHLYSIELKGQARAKAPGSITWWRRLRLEDTCLPELAAIMPLPGLTSFIGTLWMHYGDGAVPPRDFTGLDRVLTTLGSADMGEVRLWLEVDCDIWPGLARILGQLPSLAEVVVRARHPHPLEPRDLAALAGAATRLQYLDLNNCAIDDEGLRPLGELPLLRKLCLGLAERPGQDGHTPEAVKWMARLMTGRARPSLIVAPHLHDGEMEELEEWQAEDPATRGSVTVAEALPSLELPLPGDPAVSGGPFFRNGGGAGGRGGGAEGGRHGAAGGAGGAGGGGGGAGGGGGGGGGMGSTGGRHENVPYSLVDPDDPLVLLSNDVNDFFRRIDL